MVILLVLMSQKGPNLYVLSAFFSFLTNYLILIVASQGGHEVELSGAGAGIN